MTVAGYEICNGVNSVSRPLTQEFFPLLIVFPCHVCFALFFLFQLWRHNHIKIGVDSNTTIDVPFATVVFILTSLLATSLAFGNEIIEPIRQMHYAPVMPLCQISRFFSWVIGGCVYGTQLKVFITRLDIVFQRWQSLIVPRKVIRSFTFAILVSGSLAVSLFVVRSVFMDCWTEQRYGWIGNTSLFPKTALFCNVEPKYLWLRLVASVQVLIVYVGCAILLLYCFLWRMKEVRMRSNNERFDHMVHKSTFVAILCLTSTIAALILTGLTGWVALIYVDYLINNLGLYLLFSFGDQIYDILFSKLVRTSNRIRRTLEDALATPRVANSPRADRTHAPTESEVIIQAEDGKPDSNG